MTSISSYQPARNTLWNANPDWIDARFGRAVDMIQSLPRSGPVQPNYDDKLNLYSYYKQATEGDVKIKRPGMLDVLGRAKWDAWNKRKSLDEDEAKRMYVETVIKIFRGFSDRPEAVEPMKELEHFTLERRVAAAGPMSTGSSATSDTEGDTRSGPRQSTSRRIYQPPLANATTHRHHQGRVPHRDNVAATRVVPMAPTSTAPSLPGYGPPRTRADSPIGQNRRQSRRHRGNDSSSTASESEYTRSISSSGNLQEKRRRRPQQESDTMQTAPSVALSHSGQVPHSHQINLADGPNRVLSPPPNIQGQHTFPGFPSPYGPITRVTSSVRSGPQMGLGDSSYSYGQDLAMQYPPNLRPLSPSTPQMTASYAASHLRPTLNTQSGSAIGSNGLDKALDRIQTSLTALHERLAELEQNRLSAGRSGIAGGSNLQQSIVDLLKLLFLKTLVLLQIRSSSEISGTSTTQVHAGAILLKLFLNLLGFARRIVGDLAVVLLLIGILGGRTGAGRRSVVEVLKELFRVVLGNRGNAVTRGASNRIE